MKNIKIGDIVYQPYTPSKYGKVIEVGEKNKWDACVVQVKWKDGTVSAWQSYQLNSLEKLIADHEKKIDTHKRTLAKAREELK